MQQELAAAAQQAAAVQQVAALQQANSQLMSAAVQAGLPPAAQSGGVLMDPGQAAATQFLEVQQGAATAATVQQPTSIYQATPPSTPQYPPVRTNNM